MVNGWKVTAIIFITLFLLILSFNVWGYNILVQEEKETNNCYYNICEEYPDAVYDNGLCTCYEIDEFGEYEITKTEYVK